MLYSSQHAFVMPQKELNIKIKLFAEERCIEFKVVLKRSQRHRSRIYPTFFKCFYGCIDAADLKTDKIRVTHG